MPTLLSDQQLNPLVWRSLAEAIKQMQYQPSRVVVIHDILADYSIFNNNLGYSIQCQPGQAVAIGLGVATANPALKVFVMSTASYLSQSLIALSQAAAANHNMTILLGSDQLPTQPPCQPLVTALTSGATLIARAFSADTRQLQQVIAMAAKHNGLALIDILHPSHTANQPYTYAWYRQHLTPLPASQVTQDSYQALVLLQPSQTIATGIIYQQKSASFQSKLLRKQPIPLVDQPLKNIAIKPLLTQLK